MIHLVLSMCKTSKYQRTIDRARKSGKTIFHIEGGNNKSWTGILHCEHSIYQPMPPSQKLRKMEYYEG
jgi:hypothetical protein